MVNQLAGSLYASCTKEMWVVLVTVGVSMVHKLTMEHINLTSFSKMRVDLAAQVS